MKKIILIILGVGIIIGIVVALYVFRKSDTGAITRKADYILSADSLVNLFSANEDSANKMFLDKVMQVKGRVAEINKDTTGYTILLRNEEAMEGVSCALGNDQFEKAKELKTGAIIEIKGLCAGKLIDVSLNKCSILKE
jgi:hypothetical protein